MEVVEETPNIKTFVLVPEKSVAFRTGQFVEVTVPGVGEAPFTPSSSPSEPTRLEVTVMQAGRVTSALHTLQAGASVGVRGPFGKGYPWDSFVGQDVLILGGGVGLAPLRSLLFSLFEGRERFKRIVLCYGARTPADLLYKEHLRQWSGRGDVEVHLTVDKGNDGWRGKVGVVTTALDDVTVDPAAAVSVVCGPPIMMKFGTMALLKKGFLADRVYLSMERNMSCGIGKCGHCRIGPYYACRDGPVFTFAQLEGIPHLW
jgi:NAD(P)H-flavin reductase